ncbi:GDSL lipase/acylhydrolase [Artomyces pyxidatus]|uniref:GDSL lipase/acylhydrolase n=1 Tax=Artomyces pyxidatus TaxID=48021 RepID=A0ACB8SJD2_9AGAM|nr:GDSL lipase/acylhydrolase [Artomyces pyxidatus]
MVRLSFLASLASLLPLALAAHGPAPGQIKNLATFGDSYTDVVVVSNGGTQWPVYASGYAHVKLFPYARSGAPCSQLLTPRPWPAVVQDEIPLYLTELKNGSIKVPAQETLYTLWIGTNDLGPNTLVSGASVVNNTNIVDVTSCAVGWINTLYEHGARNFLFQNMLPSEHLPIYAPDAYFSRYWSAPRNATEWHMSIGELTAAYNEIAKLKLQALPSSLPGAHIGLFDSHSLFTNILTHPASYLNGTAPLNTTGAVNACVFQENESLSDPGVCTTATGSAKDSFVWYDELHPSEQSDRIVAREIANVIQGKGSQYATWFS